VQKVEDIPGPLRPFFTEREGTWHLSTEDHPDTARLAEFRTNNRDLHQKLKDAEAKLAAFDGLDPVQAREALAKAAAAPEHEQKLRDTEAALAAERQAHHVARVRASLGFEFMRQGGQPEALEFVIDKAAKVWRPDEKTGDLTTDQRDAQGVRLTPESWVRDLAATAPFVFRPSKGGGAGGTRQGPPVDARVVVDRHDALAVGRALEDIASGKARVS
jgi:hypothetical protein